MMRPGFYEFFAGGGMARAGLGEGWNCLFANDFDHKKSIVYNENWGFGSLKTGDVRDIRINDLPGRANLVWGSFPCQDLSLAGGGAGLRGDRSGTFWPFWKLMTELIEDERAPEIIVLENVCGTLTSHKGKDFAAICDNFHAANYLCGALVVDAVRFVPQSRPRLFIIGVKVDLENVVNLTSKTPTPMWHPPALMKAYKRLSPLAAKSWRWWSLPAPITRMSKLSDIIEENPTSVGWHAKEETERLLSMMSKINKVKVEEARKTGKRVMGCIYKRTRNNEYGVKVQRAEVRFDEIAGCLRTPAGGSSRQIILVVEGEKIRSRLISTRETARLMGLPDTYKLPENYNEAYHLTGDGVCVPVVRHLATHIFEPVIENVNKSKREAVA